MGRRFPTPVVGIERAPEWSGPIVELAIETDGELTRDEFVTRCQEHLRKPDGERYTIPYLKRVLSTYLQLGIIREVDSTITVWEFGHDLASNEIDYDEFLWRAIKRSCVLEAEFPEGIEGLRRVHYVVTHAEEPISTSSIRERLRDDFGYEYNDSGIRGYPDLLKQLRAIEQTEDGYVPGPRSDTYEGRFRGADIFHKLERWLNREGPLVETPDDSIKRDLAKYYMYRESGGWGRHRQLFKRFLRDYVKDTSLENDVSNPTISRSKDYVDEENSRKSLRREITSSLPGIDGQELAGLTSATLEEMAAAETESEARRIKAASSPGISRRDLRSLVDEERATYEFPAGFELYDWQREAVAEWFEANESSAERGIAQVVTGAGKTVMALEAIRVWLDRHPEGVVTVVVPTKVLMHQWLREFVEKLNVPISQLGWAGDGHKDDHTDSRILVAIVNSAVKDDFLADSLEQAAVDDHLLVADECHRYTGDVHSGVVRCRHTASLGLSATPLSTIDPNQDELTESDELLLDRLGQLFYRLSYEEGLDRGLISAFTVRYIGFELTPAERYTYEQFSKKVSSAIQDIEARYGDRLWELRGSYPQKLQTIRESIDGPTPAIADFFEYTKKRRELIAEAVARQAITLRLLEDAVEAGEKTIVFQERIDQLEQIIAPHDQRGRNSRTGEYGDQQNERAELYRQYEDELKSVDQSLEDLFFSGRYAPVMYHSGHHNESWNDWAIEWFRDDGFANVMLSVQALKEGVDVPSADVGIIRVSSGNVRDRIQTLGRILRTGHDPQTSSVLNVLYAIDTVDQRIFEAVDWEDEIGGDHEYYRWETGESAIRGVLDGPDPAYKPAVSPFEPIEPPDVSDMARGDPYEGPRRGRVISVDADGRPFEDTSDGRRYIVDEEIEELASYVYRLRRGGGRIIINEADHMLTVSDEGPVFLGVLATDSFDYVKSGGSVTEDPPDDYDAWLDSG